jgi:hypothetical protein
LSFALLTAISTATRVALLGNAPGLVCREIDMGIVDLGGEALEEARGPRASISGSKKSRVRPRISACSVAEDALARGIEGFDVARVVDRDDGVLDVVEDRLQMRCGLFADLPGQRLRLVGHELHGAHDAAPLGIDAIVVRAHGFEQRGKSSSPPRVRASAIWRSSSRFKLSVRRGSLRMAAAISRDKSLISRTQSGASRAP